MKFIYRLSFIFAILLIITNIIFGSVYLQGFYYFYSVLIFIASVFIVLETILLFNFIRNKIKYRNENVFDSAIEAELDFQIDDEFLDDTDYYESQEVEKRARFKEKILSKVMCNVSNDEVEQSIHVQNLKKRFVSKIMSESYVEEEENNNSNITKIKERIISIINEAEDIEAELFEPYVPQIGARRFEVVIDEICEYLSEYNTEMLMQEINYWAPEHKWENLTNYINNNIPKRSYDPFSVRVYAILCNRSEDVIYRNFKRNGK